MLLYYRLSQDLTRKTLFFCNTVTTIWNQAIYTRYSSKLQFVTAPCVLLLFHLFLPPRKRVTNRNFFVTPIVTKFVTPSFSLNSFDFILLPPFANICYKVTKI